MHVVISPADSPLTSVMKRDQQGHKDTLMSVKKKQSPSGLLLCFGVQCDLKICRFCLRDWGYWHIKTDAECWLEETGVVMTIEEFNIYFKKLKKLFFFVLITNENENQIFPSYIISPQLHMVTASQRIKPLIGAPCKTGTVETAAFAPTYNCRQCFTLKICAGSSLLWQFRRANDAFLKTSPC